MFMSRQRKNQKSSANLQNEKLIDNAALYRGFDYAARLSSNKKSI
jgi:hypothetical protein